MFMFCVSRSILRAQHVRALGELAGAHALEQVQALRDGRSR